MKQLLSRSLLNLCWYWRPNTTLFVVNVVGTKFYMNCVWTLVCVQYTSQFHTFQVNHQNLQWNACAHVNNVFSNLVKFVDFSNSRAYFWMVYKFFRINNIELKCLFVQCWKYQKSRWKGATGLHISAEPWATSQLGKFTLCSTTVHLLCGTTAAELLHNSVDLVCGTTAAERQHTKLN